MELRWLDPIRIVFPLAILTDARLEEVSTRPFISALIASTPCGADTSAATNLLATPTGIAFFSCATGSATALIAGSVTAYSLRISAANWLNRAMTASSLFTGIAITAVASRAIALRLFPPSIEQRSILNCAKH